MNINRHLVEFQSLPAIIAMVSIILISAVPPSNGTASQGKSPFINLSSNWKWIDETWTGNNAIYDQAKANLDEYVLGQKQFNTMLNNYKILAKKNPSDTIMQFRWGYLAWKSISNFDNSKSVQLMNEVAQALANAPSPHTYQFTRLRLLIGNWVEFYYPPNRVLHTRFLGERLLGRNPNDNDVKYVLARTLDISGNPENRQLALQYAQELVQALPERPSVRGLLGSIYYTSWQFSKQQTDAEKSITAYQQYLNLVPANDKFRATALAMIDKLKKYARK